MVDWACQLTEKDLERYQYKLSDTDKELVLLEYEGAMKTISPAFNYYEKKLYGEAQTHAD